MNYLTTVSFSSFSAASAWLNNGHWSSDCTVSVQGQLYVAYLEYFGAVGFTRTK